MPLDHVKVHQLRADIAEANQNYFNFNSAQSPRLFVRAGKYLQRGGVG